MAAPFTALTWGSFMLLIQLFPSHSICMVGHTHLGVWQRVTQSLYLPYMAGRDSFPGCLLPSDTVHSESLVGIKSGDSGVVIEFQAD